MAEGKEVVKYKAKDGQELSLTFETVRAYLVQGDREKVTPQELMFFMGMCKSRGLNPFKKDAYLIKYGDDPAAIVVSIDYFRARARAQKDCRGWKAGVMVQINGKIERREGSLVLETEKLLGGWFEAKPDGWTEPRFHSVNLKGYIKRTKTGNITRFWSEENQPSQIMKVAESQGLRMVWPDEFQQLYTEEEINAHRQDPEDAMAVLSDEARETAIGKFKKSIPEPLVFEHPMLQEFLGKLAQANRCTVDDVMIDASQHLAEFWMHYEEYRDKNEPPAAEEKKDTQPENSQGPPAGSNAELDAEIENEDLKKEGKTKTVINVISVMVRKTDAGKLFIIKDKKTNEFLSHNEDHAQKANEAKSIDGDLEVVWSMKDKDRWIESMRIPIPGKK